MSLSASSVSFLEDSSLDALGISGFEIHPFARILNPSNRASALTRCTCLFGKSSLAFRRVTSIRLLSGLLFSRGKERRVSLSSKALIKLFPRISRLKSMLRTASSISARMRRRSAASNIFTSLATNPRQGSAVSFRNVTSIPRCLNSRNTRSRHERVKPRFAPYQPSHNKQMAVRRPRALRKLRTRRGMRGC